MIKAKKVDELVKKINKTEGLVVVEGGDDKINRAALENKKVDVLIGPEKGRIRDFTHYRNSGLNQVLCRLAKKNNIAIGFDFDDILNTNFKAKILGRMMQNVKLCRKYKVKMIIIDLKEERSKEELRSFGISLGMTAGEAKKAVKY